MEGNQLTEGCIIHSSKDSNKLVKLQDERSWSALTDAAVIQEVIFSKLVSSSVTKRVLLYLKTLFLYFYIHDSKFKSVAYTSKTDRK